MKLKDLLEIISIGNPVLILNWNSPMGRMMPREIANIKNDERKGITEEMLDSEVKHIYTEATPSDLPMYKDNPIIIQLDWHKPEQAPTEVSNARNKRVKCLNNGVIYESIKAASDDLGIPYRTLKNAISLGQKAKGYEFVEVKYDN